MGRQAQNYPASILTPTLAGLPYRRTRIGFAVAAAVAGAAVSQRAPAAAADVSGGIQEVVVTARKVSENLQDVPLSVDVFTQRDMQNLAITSLEDYVQKSPSISFISVGPGTQVIVMRGASDGSTPNYANTSSTGFFLDDTNLAYGGSQPDLHLYDLERIEVLEGPQGTTFGAGSMTGAVRYITMKPDVNAISAGADLDVGHMQGGRNNQTYDGFLNLPLIPGVLGARFSAFSSYSGGFIDNQLTTRTWENGAVSDNSAWARDDYNRAHSEGGRAALRLLMGEKWSASLTFQYQRQSTLGAWDQDPNLAPRTVQRFGPESHDLQTKTLDLHVEGDVGIGDLVYAGTYWSIPFRQQNEYSQYMENLAPYSYYYGAYVKGAQEGFACKTDPFYSVAGHTPGDGSGVTPSPFSGCQAPLQTYEYHTNPERWSHEIRLQSKAGGRFHWLGGYYWEKTRDKNSGSTYYMPGLRVDGQAFQYELYAYGTTQSSLPAGVWYAYTTRSDYLQQTEFANINFDITDKLNVEVGTVHFHSDFKYYSPFGQFAYAPTTPSLNEGSSHKWNSKVGLNYKLTKDAMVYAIFSQGFRDGGTNSGYPQSCYDSGVPPKYTPDTLNNYEFGWKTTNLRGRLIWNGAVYQMDWKQLQTIIYDVGICAPSSFYVNVGDAKIKGVESNIQFAPNQAWSFQAAFNYNDARIVSSPYATFQPNIGERLPFSPYLSWSANARYQAPVSNALRAYAQFDISHKGDMWDDLHVQDVNGFPRMLQPAYTLMNLRIGLNPDNGRWLAELYCENLADKNAIIYTNTGNFDLRETTNQPRTIGLRLNYRFGKETNAE
ncbi:MAG TPA: TonB-dependent receptor [Steroidobacteraceae bacterium]|jgi:outer membrane receptor protein involved in Fe transport